MASLAATGSVGVVLAWLDIVLIRHRFALGLWIIAVALLAVFLVRSRVGGKLAVVGTTLGVSVVITQVAWLGTGIHPLGVICSIVAIASGFASLVAAWSMRTTDRWRRARRAVKVAIAIPIGCAAGGAVLISALMITLAASPAPVVRALQDFADSNSFESRTPMSTTIFAGAGLTSDIEYGSTLPNSYLDVYIADNDRSVSRPTYVMVHGGGWVAGDKADGDPGSSTGSPYFAAGAGPVLGAGYNLVSVNYAFAPEYRFPTQTRQLGEALQFLNANSDRYGLDMSRIVLAGSSAGGQIVGSYANVQTNPEYARAVGIEPTIDRSALKAMVFDSALLDVGRAGTPQSPSPSNGFGYELGARSYLDTTDAESLALANVVDHATSDFPPSFIADGNTGTFPDQAAELSATLDRVGVENRLNLYSRNEATLDHAFMVTGSRWTEEYNRSKIEFLRDVV
ncbi:alpha/beta hydrolase [Rhodococcus sp. 06-235-1A]|uniref:alpha/beta hydrolase n=1 Tax=Rhodococcus sp. 06-235-1A TaxID=2022508 RepID=UPI00117BD1D9|nr:alpha/beta hydrolase [Rhodococcus sp. 06-235-1A]